VLVVANEGAGLQRAAIDGDADRLQPHPVQHERALVVAISPDAEARFHARRRRVEREVQIDAVDQEGGRLVVGQADWRGRFCAHGGI
jgi:hypothetical protein